MKDVEEIMLFVGKMTKQTEEDLAFQRRSDPDDEWMKFLEGKLQAFKLVQGFLADLQSRRVKLHCPCHQIPCRKAFYTTRSTPSKENGASLKGADPAGKG